MAGTTSWIISNLMSTIQRLSQFMHPFPSLPSTSTSSFSSIAGEISFVDADSIQERLMEDLSRLTRMLQRIQAVLQDAEEREIYDKAIQLWLRELKEIAYDVEDVLDEYDYQVIKTQVEGMTIAAEAEPSLKRKRADNDDIYGFQYDQVSQYSSTPTKIPISCNMAKRIIKIIEKFDEIAKDREALQLREEDGIRQSTFDDPMKRPPSSSLVNDSDIFGREDDKKKIIQILMSNSEKENTVIPIVGLGGVGKTTLAQLVYNDEVVCEHFSPKVWICISEEFDVVRITKEIVTTVIGHRDNNNLNDLQCMLRKALLEKKFLFILDDVWNERSDMWEALRAPFSGVGMGKIIVTTRSMSVARIMQTVPPYELECLDKEKSWLLFQRHAFCGWKLDQRMNFQHIGREIVKKCGGLPLALKAIGGFLQYEVEEQIWKDVLNNNLWEFEETKNLILPSLWISYNHMPGYLKPCFVYASLFPKNHEFVKEEMVGMWIAQGYINHTGKKRLLENIAFEYFEDLERRSFFQCSQINKRFTLHDMMHDLARSIARNEIYSLFDFKELKNMPKNAKHILIKHARVDHAALFGAIRTFYTVNTFHPLQDIYFMESIPYFGCLYVLRLDLHLNACSLQFVNLIGNLLHLRYLFIHASKIKMETHSLCSLYKLQTLKLVSDELNMLPHKIEKLINLRHLVIRCCNLKILPTSIFWPKNLLTLDINFSQSRKGFVVFPFSYKTKKMRSDLTLPDLRRDGQYSDIGWLENLMNLQESLEIYMLQNVVNHEDAKSANLQNKPHIKSLKLSWRKNEDDDECYWINREVAESTRQAEVVLDGLQPHINLKKLTIVDYGGRSFPSWFGNPHFSNLLKISLINLKNIEECKFLPLSWLPSLISLKLKNFNGIRRIEQDFWYCNAPRDGRENYSTKVHLGFHLLDCPQLKEWPTVKSRDFLSLKCLHILHCHKLELLSILPSNLEEFEVEGCERLEYLSLEDSSGPLSRLHKVTIVYCHNLKFVNSLNNLLATLKFLILFDCPLLQLSPDESLHYSLKNLSLQNTAHVAKCPGMRIWCEWHGLTYEEGSSDSEEEVCTSYWDKWFFDDE